MATLEEVRELVTAELRKRVDRLVSVVEDDAQDFLEVARRADAVGELVDTVARIYADLEQMLPGALEDEEGRQDEDDSHRGEKRRRREQRQGERSDENGASDGSPADEVTKEELLERAREVNVQGRSSMSKEELAEAVDAEESLTKEELLERASEAGIEGRSSMTKKELRRALNDAGS